MDELLILRQAEALRDAIGMLAGSTATDAANKLAAFTEQLRRLEGALAATRQRGAIQTIPGASPYSLAGQGGSLASPLPRMTDPVPVDVVRLPKKSERPPPEFSPSAPAPTASPEAAAGGGQPRAMADIYAEQTARVAALAKQERERAKYLASPAGLAMLQQQAKAARELAAAQREARYAGVAADQGAMAAGMVKMKDQTAGLQQSYASLMSTAQSTYQAGASAMMSLVAAGDPFSTWPTFQASVEGLSISIGQTLVPYIDTASWAIQKLTKGFDGLSDTAKGWVGFTIAGSTALAGIVLVGGKVVSTLLAIGSTMRSAAAAGIAMNAAMGPIGWMTLLGGIGTATAGLITYADAWGTVADKARAAGGVIAGAIGAGSIAGESTDPEQLKKLKRREAQAITVEEMGRLPWDVRKQMMDPKQTAEGRAKIIEDYAVKARARMEEAQREATALPAAQVARDELEARLVRERHEVSRQEYLRYTQNRTPDMTPREVLEERSARTSARRLMADLAEKGEAPKDAAAYEEMTRSLADRIALALGGKDYSRLRQQTTNTAAENAAAAAKEQADLAERLRQKAGVATVAARGEPAPDSPEGIERSLRGLPQAQVSDNQSYADRLTVAALSGSDLDNQNRQKMLATLEGSKDLLSDMAGSMRDLTARLNFPKSWR